MYVRVCVYIYIYICVIMCVYSKREYVYIHGCVCLQVHLSSCVGLCVFLCVCVWLCVRVCVCVVCRVWCGWVCVCLSVIGYKSFQSCIGITDQTDIIILVTVALVSTGCPEREGTVFQRRAHTHTHTHTPTHTQSILTQSNNFSDSS